MSSNLEIPPGLIADLIRLYNLKADAEFIPNDGPKITSGGLVALTNIEHELEQIRNKYALIFTGLDRGINSGPEDPRETLYKKLFSIVRTETENIKEDAWNLFTEFIFKSIQQNSEKRSKGGGNKWAANLYKIASGRFTDKDWENLFDLLYDCELLELFEFHIANVVPARTILPTKKFRKKLKAWKTENDITTITDQPEVRELEEASQDKPIVTELIPEKHKSKLIPVSEIIRWGSGDELLSHQTGEALYDSGLPAEHRIVKVLDVLSDIGIADDCIENIYFQNDAFVIDLTTEHGHRAQVLVADYRDIFVVRNNEFNPDEDLPLQRSPDKARPYEDKAKCLVNRDEVFKTDMPREGYSIDNSAFDYVRVNLSRFLFTPLSTLLEDPQNKHKVTWPDKGKEIIHTIVSNVVRTGRVPVKDNKRTFEYGAMGKSSNNPTSPYRMYHALYKKRIAGLADHELTSLRKLWDHLVEENPALKSFENGTPISDISKVFEGCKDVITRTNCVPCIANAKELDDKGVKIAEHSVSSIAQAFEFCSFADGRDAADQDPASSNTLDDYVVRAGLARRQADGTLIPEVQAA